MLPVKTAVIIIGHDSDANLSLASRALSDHFDSVVAVDWSDPLTSIPAAVSFLPIVDRTVIFPYCLELNETERDLLESAVREATTAQPEVDVRLAPHLTFDRRLVDLIEDRVVAASNESSAADNLPILTVEARGKATTFTLQDLLDLPDRLPDIRQHVPDRSGEAIGVGTLVSTVAVSGDETRATFKSGDDFSADVDLEIARKKGWFVFWLDGQPLPARYGGPVRLLIPGIDDRCANVKSVDRMILS